MPLCQNERRTPKISAKFEPDHFLGVEFFERTGALLITSIND